MFYKLFRLFQSCPAAFELRGGRLEFPELLCRNRTILNDCPAKTDWDFPADRLHFSENAKRWYCIWGRGIQLNPERNLHLPDGITIENARHLFGVICPPWIPCKRQEKRLENRMKLLSSPEESENSDGRRR